MTEGTCQVRTPWLARNCGVGRLAHTGAVPEIPYDVTGVPDELTEETAKFVARANCVDAVRRYTEGQYGGDVHRALATAVAARVRVGRRRVLLPGTQRLLRVAWQTEAAARFADASDDSLLQRVSAQTLPVQTYYAVFNAFRAMTAASGAPVDQHSALQEDFAKNRTAKMPLPWSVTLTGDPDDPASCRLTPAITVPEAFNPVSTKHEPEDYVWAALRMARRWKVEVARREWIKHHRRSNGQAYKALPKGKRAEIVTKLRPTTILDFIYELRRQANYETADEYASDANDAQVARFHTGMTFLTDTGLLLAEASIAAYCGFDALNRAAEEWQSSTKRLGEWAAAPLRRRLDAISGSVAVPPASV